MVVCYLSLIYDWISIQSCYNGQQSLVVLSKEGNKGLILGLSAVYSRSRSRIKEDRVKTETLGEELILRFTVVANPFGGVRSGLIERRQVSS